MYNFFLIIYYCFISRLPNSRYLKSVNKIRVWYLYRILKVVDISKDCIIEEGVYISKGKSRVKIGYGCQINEKVFIQAAQIGNNVMIAPHVALLSDTHITTSTEMPMALQGKTDTEPIVIEDDVWIGRNVVIMPGCTIAKGAIIGAGAVVTKSIPSYAVAVGVPAKVIKYRR